MADDADFAEESMEVPAAPAEAEIAAASQVASELGIQHEVIAIDCTAIGSGDMAGDQATG